MMKRLTLLLWVAGLFILGLSSLHAQTGGPFLPSAADNRCRQWVDSVLSGLNVHEKVGQLIVATIPARADKATKKQMRELVKKYKVGGLLFSEGTPEEQAILTKYGPEGCQDSRYGYFRWRVGTVNEAERRSGLSP